MAGDDLNEAPKETTTDASADAPKTVVKKKVTRKKAPQVKTAAKKKVSVKKRAAPKKKAARKGGAVAPGSEIAGAEDTLQVTEASTPSPVAPSAHATAPEEKETDGAGETATVVAEAAQSAVPQVSTAAITPDKGAQNTHVQKRLEEMGLMPSDSTENQTPPPPPGKKTGLGFWQKSFIWVIVIAAGLLYIQTLPRNGGDSGDDEGAKRSAETANIEQTVAADVTPSTADRVTATAAPADTQTGMTDSATVEFNRPQPDMAQPSASAGSDSPVETTAGMASDNGSSEMAMTKGDKIPSVTEKTALPTAEKGKTTEEEGAANDVNRQQLADRQQAITTPEESSSETSQQPSPAVMPSIAHGTDGAQASAEDREQPAIVTESESSTTTTHDDSGPLTEKSAPTVAGAAGSGSTETSAQAGTEGREEPAIVAESSDSPTSTSESNAPSTEMAGTTAEITQQQPATISPRLNRPGLPSMWNNAGRRTANAWPPRVPVPAITRNQTGIRADGLWQNPGTGMYGRYPAPGQQSYEPPRYPRGVYNPQPMPYYWPYPPRPPIYGPVVRYPYNPPPMPR